MAKEIIDIMIYESGDGGELKIVNDDLQVTEGLTNQVYLALYGGNVEQNTAPELDSLETREDYWGNLLLEDEFQFNSNFERTINQVALNSDGLKRLIEAAKLDLTFLNDYADVAVDANIIGINKLELLVTLTKPSNISNKLKFIWDGTKRELEIIEQVIL